MPERAREGLQHAADRRRRRPTALRYRFDKARETAGTAKGEFQFRDLRAKAGTDKADSAKDIREAQAQLGHSSVTTTEIYVRKKRGRGRRPRSDQASPSFNMKKDGLSAVFREITGPTYVKNRWCPACLFSL
ncbi:tyrosine-type recombinase/integrase [Stenotrophomonas riyadhensis]